MANVAINITTEDGELLERIIVLPVDGDESPSFKSIIMAKAIREVIEHRFCCVEDA